MNQRAWGSKVKPQVTFKMTENGPAKFRKKAGSSGRHFSKFGGLIFRYFLDDFPAFFDLLGLFRHAFSVPGPEPPHTFISFGNFGNGLGSLEKTV